jgi:hypothetical protein
VIESLVNTLLQWATRRSRLVTNAAALLAGVAIAALPHLQVDTDVLHLLPRNGPATPAFTRYLHEFGSLDRVYVRARQIERAGLDVQRAREDLATATTAAGFRASAFAPFDERLPRVLQPRQRLTCDGFQQNGLEDVLAPLVRATPGGYTAVAYAFPTTPAQADGVERAVRAVGGTLVLTGMPVVNRELETRLLAAVPPGARTAWPGRCETQSQSTSPRRCRRLRFARWASCSSPPWPERSWRH